MTYSPRDAIVHITTGFGVPLTDEEITLMIVESIDSIEQHGMAVRQAAKKYEEFVISLAADMVARRPCAMRPAMRNESPKRSD